MVNVAFKMLKKTVEKKANFNIEKLEPIKAASACFIPCLFAHATDDDFIDPSHSLALYVLDLVRFPLLTHKELINIAEIIIASHSMAITTLAAQGNV